MVDFNLFQCTVYWRVSNSFSKWIPIPYHQVDLRNKFVHLMQEKKNIKTYLTKRNIHYKPHYPSGNQTWQWEIL